MGVQWVVVVVMVVRWNVDEWSPLRLQLRVCDNVYGIFLERSDEDALETIKGLQDESLFGPTLRRNRVICGHWFD